MVVQTVINRYRNPLHGYLWLDGQRIMRNASLAKPAAPRFRRNVHHNKIGVSSTMNSLYKQVHTNWVGLHSSRSGYERASLRTHGNPRQVSHHVCKLIFTLCLASLIPTLNFSMNERPGGPRRNSYNIDCYLHISCV